MLLHESSLIYGDGSCFFIVYLAARKVGLLLKLSSVVYL